MKVVPRDSRRVRVWFCTAWHKCKRPCSGAAEGWWECGCLHAALRVHEDRAAVQQQAQSVVLHGLELVQEAMQRGSRRVVRVCLHAAQ